MAASWPTSIPTDATLYVAVNELQTNLSSGVNNAVTTIPLNSTTGFPTVGLVLIDNEIIKYTGVSGGNLTGATRGFDGTTAASHSSAAVVSFAICAQHHNVTKDEIIALATYLSNNLGTGAQPLANGSRALASNGSGKIIESSVTSTELGYLSGVTSAIQTQLSAVVTTANAALPKTGGTMSGAIAMGSSKITGLAAASTNGDAVRYEQPLMLAGGTMAAAIAMGSNKITGLAAATANGDAVRFEQVSGLRVLQIVSFHDTSASAKTSSSFAATTTTLSITAATTGNKILIFAVGNLSNATGDTNAQVSLFKDTTNLATTNTAIQELTNRSGSTNRTTVPCSLIFADTAADTSAHSYTVYLASSNNSSSVSWNFGPDSAYIIAVEVG